jgi:hypothetical protein
MSDTSPKDAVKADELIAFLDGSGPLDGVWFGEEHPTLKGKFWWRKYLPALSQVRKQARKDAFDEAMEVVGDIGQDAYKAFMALRELAVKED